MLALPLVPASLLSHHIPSLLSCLFIAFAVFFTALFSSMTLYRISPLHPLAGNPGPLLWRVTKFSAAYYGAFGKYHIKLKQLHERYGPIVRIGTALSTNLPFMTTIDHQQSRAQRTLNRAGRTHSPNSRIARNAERSPCVLCCQMTEMEPH